MSEDIVTEEPSIAPEDKIKALLTEYDLRLDTLEARANQNRKMIKLILPLGSSILVFMLSSLLSGLSIHTKIGDLDINLDLETNDVVTLISAAGVTLAATKVVDQKMGTSGVKV